MTFRAAFQKAGDKFCGPLIKRLDKGPYSHCELVFSDGWWGSSYHPRGVVLRALIHVESDWDFVDLPVEWESDARKWFEQYKGKPYDYTGCLRFLLRTFRPSRDKWFCSRACADALGMVDGWRAGPNGLYAALNRGLGYHGIACTIN